MKDDFRFKEPKSQEHGIDYICNDPRCELPPCRSGIAPKYPKRPPYAPVELSMANAGITPEAYEKVKEATWAKIAESVQGSKHDSGKPDLSLVSSELMTELALVRQFGSAKYARDNWKLGFKYNRSIAAALRHIMAFKDGEDLDPESGLTHIGHALASLEHLLYDYKHHKANDDRKT